MNKSGLTILLVIGVSVLAVLGYYVFSQQKTAGVDGVQEAAMMQDTNTSTTNTTNNENGSVPNSQKYVAYSDDALANAAGKRIVLFFYANWCPTCRPADAEIGKNAGQIPDDVVVIRVNYNDSDTDASEEALANKYSITYQHTFVLLNENGNEADRWNGGSLKDVLTRL